MDDETWSLYVEAMKLQKAGLSDVEVLQRMDMSEKDATKVFSAAISSLMSFNCVSMEKLIEIGMDVDY